MHGQNDRSRRTHTSQWIPRVDLRTDLSAEIRFAEDNDLTRNQIIGKASAILRSAGASSVVRADDHEEV